MDRRVKERLVGASVLVALVVLIVPELLSGPKQAAIQSAPSTEGPADVHNVVVDMTTSKATPTEDDPAAPAALPVDPPAVPATAEGAAADAPGATPAPPATVPRRVAPPSVVTLQAQPPAAAPAAVENTPTTPRSTSASHNWSVQVGSFAGRVNAETLQRNLKAKGLAAFVSPAGSGKAARYRVRVGPVADRAGAEKLIARLRKEGHAASVVAP